MHDTLDVHFNEFLESFSRIQLLKSAIDQSANAEFRRIESNEKILELQGKSNQIASIHNMFYKRLDGQHIFYDFQTRRNEELLQDLRHHLNKQYSWLLAEAFEVFETLINATYAQIGFNDPSQWSPKELKQKIPQSPISHDYEWFLSRAGMQRNISNKMTCIRNALPKLSTLELKNSYEINFRFVISLIENLRHVIIHNGGKIKSESAFVSKILRSSGVSRAGAQGDLALKHIKSFINQSEDGHAAITMLDISTDQPMMHLSRLNTTLNWLLAYGDFVAKGVSKKCADLSHHKHFTSNRNDASMN